MLLYAAVAVAAGTAAGHGREAFAWPATAAAIGLLIFLVGVRTRQRAAAVAAVLAVASGAAASAAWRSASVTERMLPAMAEDGTVARVCGTVVRLRPRSVELGAERLDRGGRAWRVAEPVRVSGDDVKRSRPGERMCALGELSPPRPGRNEPPLLHADRIERGGVASPLRFGAGAVRRRFSDAAQEALPKRQAGLLLGMTDGDTELLDEQTMEEFRTTGLAHLVAVSGSNVAVLLALVMVASRALIPRGRWLRALVAVPPLAFFAFLTGLEPSVLRATVSAGIALAVVAGGRTTDALHAAAFAFVALVLLQPDILFHPGFQLSFGATLGLIMWARPLTERIATVLPDARPARALAIAAGTTVAAQIAVAPLLAWHFGRVPALGGLANLVAVPLAGVVMVGGVVTLTAASLVPFLDWAPATMRLLVDVILGAAHVFAHVPGASLATGVLAAGALTAVLAAVAARSTRIRGAALVLMVVFAATAGGQTLAASHASCDGGEVRALDVGQGTAVLVRSGEHAVLLDGGPADGGVVRQLQALGVDRLDAIVVSHPHADHMEGFIDVLTRLRVGRVVGPVIVGWGVGSGLVRAAKAAHVPVVAAAAGDVIEAGPIRLDVLAPAPGPAPELEQPERVNAYSLLIRARVGDASVLAPGDLGADEQAALVTEDLRSPILVAPHHGSGDLDPAFVAAVAPRLVLVTVGADNPYGHPTPKALAMFERYGPVMRTDRHGLVTVCLRAGGADVWAQSNDENEPAGRRGPAGPRIPQVFE